MQAVLGEVVKVTKVGNSHYALLPAWLAQSGQIRPGQRIVIDLFTPQEETP